MSAELDQLRVDAERFRADFDALAQFGATGNGGVHRPTFSEAHLSARAWLRDRIVQDGLEFRTDSAGNHSAVLACGPAGAPTMLLGSHLDSVPYGGRFDGALGVLAALEVLRTVRDVGARLAVHLEAIDWTDEEGTLIGFLGSGAVAGHLSKASFENPRGGHAAVTEGLERAGLDAETVFEAKRTAQSLAGYLELHIEQGNRLERATKDIGVVSAIVGITSYRLTFMGRADHAGTTSMQDRRDASQGASAFALGAREIVLGRFPNCVANVGNMTFTPGAFNIVPAGVTVSLEFRGPDADELARFEKALLERAQAEAARFDLDLKSESLGTHAPTPMSVQARAAIESACDALELTRMPLVSGAGHDGQMLAGLCPVGMIFVPSIGGASHSARELTDWQDCVNGANVLLQSALRLAGALSRM